MMEMRSLRSICGVTFMERIENGEIRRKVGVQKKLSDGLVNGDELNFGVFRSVWIS